MDEEKFVEDIKMPKDPKHEKSKSQARRLKHQLPPGSEEAIEAGCECPVIDNEHGKGVGDGLYWMNGGCPLHGALEENMSSENIEELSRKESFLKRFRELDKGLQGGILDAFYDMMHEPTMQELKEKITVKVIRPGKTRKWYDRCIGQEFEVYDWDRSEYVVSEDWDQNKDVIRYIQKADCIEIVTYEEGIRIDIPDINMSEYDFFPLHEKQGDAIATFIDNLINPDSNPIMLKERITEFIRKNTWADDKSEE